MSPASGMVALKSLAVHFHREKWKMRTILEWPKKRDKNKFIKPSFLYEYNKYKKVAHTRLLDEFKDEGLLLFWLPVVVPAGGLK